MAVVVLDPAVGEQGSAALERLARRWRGRHTTVVLNAPRDPAEWVQTGLDRAVARDDALRAFNGDLCPERRRAVFLGFVPPLIIGFAFDVLEAPFRVDAGAASFACIGVLTTDGLEGHRGALLLLYTV